MVFFSSKMENWIDRRILVRRPSLCRKSVLARVAQALTAAGLGVGRVEIRPDVMVVVPGKPGNVGNAAEANEWDEVLNDTPSATVR
jgi:hypothetical protein